MLGTPQPIKKKLNARVSSTSARHCLRTRIFYDGRRTRVKLGWTCGHWCAASAVVPVACYVVVAPTALLLRIRAVQMAGDTNAVTEVVAYSVPTIFVLSIGWVLLSEMATEPYGWTVAGTKIDAGSRIITLLAPTLLRLLFILALVAGGALFALVSFTKNGATELKRLASIVSGKRLD